MPDRTRIQLIVIGLGACVVFAPVGCKSERERAPGGFQQQPTDTHRTDLLLGEWSNSRDLLVARSDQDVVGDAASAACRSSGIFVVDLDGTAIRMERPWLTCGFVWELTLAALSPIGSVLAFVSKMDPVTLRLMDLETGSVSEAATRCRAPIEGVSWNSSATLIALVERCGPHDPGGSLEVVHVRTSQQAEAIAADVEGTPSWANGDQAIVVSRAIGDGRFQVVYFDRAGHALLTIDDARNPAVQPESEDVVFVRIVNGEPHLFRAGLSSTDRSEPRNLGVIPSCVRRARAAGAEIAPEMRWTRNGQILLIQSSSCVLGAVLGETLGPAKEILAP